MSMFTEAQAKAILDKVIALSKADQCTAQLEGVDRRQRPLRAQQRLDQRASSATSTSPVEVAFGKRVGIATINAFDDAALERVVRRAEDLARLAPENPEFVPAVEKQTYKATATFSPATAAITPDYRAQVAADSIKPCKANKLVAAGFLQDGAELRRVRQQQGQLRLPAGDQPRLYLHGPHRRRPRLGLGRAQPRRTRRVQRRQRHPTAMRKASASADAKALEPGKYTVILEPVAAAGLLAFMFSDFDAREADEGRSFLSKKGGGNKLGEQVFDPRVSFTADPWHPDAVSCHGTTTACPRERTPIVTDGKVDQPAIFALLGAEAGQARDRPTRQPDHGRRRPSRPSS